MLDPAKCEPPALPRFGGPLRPEGPEAPKRRCGRRARTRWRVSKRTRSRAFLPKAMIVGCRRAARSGGMLLEQPRPAGRLALQVKSKVIDDPRQPGSRV